MLSPQWFCRRVMQRLKPFREATPKRPPISPPTLVPQLKRGAKMSTLKSANPEGMG